MAKPEIVTLKYRVTKSSDTLEFHAVPTEYTENTNDPYAERPKVIKSRPRGITVELYDAELFPVPDEYAFRQTVEDHIKREALNDPVLAEKLASVAKGGDWTLRKFFLDQDD